MADPFIDAHHLRDFFYLLSSATPISIRDQMLRGTLLVIRLRDAGIIGPDAGVLIVGAGAGGVSAALTAVSLDVQTHLIESRSAAFQTQALASSRFISPAQYDWPVDHWEEHDFPWLSPVGQPTIPIPLPFSENRAACGQLDTRLK
jgi:hypothetical protein